MAKYFLKAIVIIITSITHIHTSVAQYSNQDTLRGSIGTGRSWWNVKQYNLDIDIDITNKSIRGTNEIIFDVVKTGKNQVMQIDLQSPMEIEKVEYKGSKNPALAFKREGNVYWINFGEIDLNNEAQKIHSIIIRFRGKPRVAVNAPWDGGWVWTKDEKGRPWITVACQGIGASVWYPCKDHQSDEPENGASLTITAPDSLVAIGNGRLKEKINGANNTISWTWVVTSPINNYNIIPYLGKYSNWSEIYKGENGNLDCSYWVLDYNLEKAKKQFGRDVKPMFRCFENWFGPYPFYKDSYKMIETPHLGMEHQSAVAYGNKYLDGYLGTDLSGTGWGSKWDFIIIHESGHEWFANNITTRDIADMWVHEGFTNYSEVLFVECQYGKKAADEYCQGLRSGIVNDRPIIGPYGVNKEGSADMYAKGANLVHTLRQVINNDELFKRILRGLNKDFYHKTIDSKDVEAYMIRHSAKDLSKIFDQYLRTAKIPELQYGIKGKTISYRWSNCVPGFNMPVKISFGLRQHWLKPTQKWQTLRLGDWYDGKGFYPDKNFYITSKKVDR